MTDNRSSAATIEAVLKKLRFTLQVMKRAKEDQLLGKPAPAGLMSVWEQDIAGIEGAIEILSCGAEVHRHSGAVDLEKRAEQSDPGGGHEVTDSTVMKHMDSEKPPADEPTPPAGRLGAAQSSQVRQATIAECIKAVRSHHGFSDDEKGIAVAVLNALEPVLAAHPPAAPVETMFKCNCPHETRSGCSEPKCPHYDARYWGSRSSAATGDEPDSRLPLQYEDGPDYCTVKDAQGRDFALTMQPELMQAMERALREDISRLSRPPVTPIEPQTLGQWQPIDTAPREPDAMFMVCAVGDARGPFVVRSDILWRAREAGTPSHLGLDYLTHWMPLPEMPQ